MPRGVNIYDQARIQGRLWTPTDMRDICQAWWDATYLPSLTISSSLVTTLADRSGYGRNMTATGGNELTFVANAGPIGQPLIRGTGKRMTSTVAASTFPNDLTFVAAWRKIGSTTSFNSAPLTRGATNKPAPLDAYDANRYIGNGTAFDGFTGTNLNLGTDSRITAFNIFTFGQLGTAMFDYVNGALIGNYAGTVRSDTSTRVDMATRADAGTSANLEFLEGFALNTGNPRVFQKYEGYLSWKHGIRLSGASPYRDRPPLIGD